MASDGFSYREIAPPGSVRFVPLAGTSVRPAEVVSCLGRPRSACGVVVFLPSSRGVVDGLATDALSAWIATKTPARTSSAIATAAPATSGARLPLLGGWAAGWVGGA
ncbi:hypothetical protein [Nonomuraea salmonea]|uniref:hypothetical protein n=1 Tax=Nonomuraea salmonea TaxID=46181 RepID=UPI002FEC937A